MGQEDAWVGVLVRVVGKDEWGPPLRQAQGQDDDANMGPFAKDDDEREGRQVQTRVLRLRRRMTTKNSGKGKCRSFDCAVREVRERLRSG